MNSAPVLAALSKLRGSYLNEAALQRAVAACLTAAGIDYKREHVFTPESRIDFITGGIGIECKVKGSRLEVARQLYRYAEYCDHLILVTTQASTLDPGPLRVARGTVTLEVVRLCFRM